MENKIALKSFPVFASRGGDGPPKFSMTAYTGAVVNLVNFSDPLVVVMEGIHFSQKIPIYLNHSDSKGIGHSTSIRLEDGKLIAEGIISRDNNYAADVAASGLSGYPWQASICGKIKERHQIKKGKTEIVNGRAVEGPVLVADSLELYEISFCDYGADSNTSATVSAKKERNEKMDEDKIEQVEELAADGTETVEAQAVKGGVGDDKPNVYPFVSFQERTNEGVDRERVAAELVRQSEIRDLAGSDHLKEAAEAIKDGISAERFELNLLRASRSRAPEVRGENARFSDEVVECVGLSNAGKTVSELEEIYKGKPQVLEMSEKYFGCGLQAFIEMAAGKPLGRFSQRNPDPWIKAAFTNTSVPGVLGNIANKRLLDGFYNTDSSWNQIFKKTSVKDFKPTASYRPNADFTLDEMAPGEEFKHGTFTESEFSNQVKTFGKAFAITMQMIIDDDLRAFGDIPYAFGVASADAINDRCWNLFLSNPGNFFSSSHKNLLSGSTTALSVAGLKEARTKFAKQTRPNGATLGVLPSILLVPPELAFDAEMLVKSTDLEGATAQSATYNPHRGALKVVVSPFLSDSSRTGNSSTAYYLLADPNRIPAFEIAFLNGVDKPVVQRTDLFNVLGVSYRGFIHFGVKEQEYRGALKVTGAA